MYAGSIELNDQIAHCLRELVRTNWKEPISKFPEHLAEIHTPDPGEDADPVGSCRRALNRFYRPRPPRHTMSESWQRDLARSLNLSHEEFLARLLQPPEALALNLAEAILLSDAAEHRLTKRQLDDLNRQGLAARVRSRWDDLYMVPDLGIVAALVEQRRSLEELAEATSLDLKTVQRWLPLLDARISTARGSMAIVPIKLKAVIFDWSDTLVDEYELDEAICEFIPRSQTSVQTLKQKQEFLEILNRLEEERSSLWYDYIHLAAHFGKTAEMLQAEHRRNRRRIRPLCDILHVLRVLKSHCIKVVLATDCHSEVLKWRADTIKIPLHTFDLIVTSDQVPDVKDKHHHFRLALDRLALKAQDCAVVSDDHKKDLVPGKALGCATVWVFGANARRARKAKPQRAGMDTDIEMPEARRRSMYGTPTLPPDLLIHETTLRRIQGRIADYCVPSADRVLRITGTEPHPA